MMQTIGIDFDNTIANYDNVFLFSALEYNLISREWKGNKKQLRDFLRIQEDGEHKWQRIQGKVYGKYMQQAEIFPGLTEFLLLCRIKNIKIYIVSHKTEFGHFDEEKINLREQAIIWMEKNHFFDKSYFGISKENIFFASTRTEKVQIISELKCDIFIDDLIEVFEEKTFPNDIKKILFEREFNLASIKKDTSKFRTWRQIINFCLGEYNTKEIYKILIEYLKFPINDNIELVKGNGNSKVYKISFKTNNYILKIYPDRGIDERPRLENEFSSITNLYHRGLPVPKPIQKWTHLNWAIFEFIEGTQINSITELEINKAVQFCKELKNYQKEIKYNLYNNASEACFSGDEIIIQILYRLESLIKVDYQKLNFFLTENIKKTLNKIKNYFSQNTNQFNTLLPVKYHILSPSDFGFHNAIKTNDGLIKFIDFEYFGWDDPAKLISDFYWHPAMNLNSDLKKFWLEEMIKVYEEDLNLINRINYYLPLVGIRWCLILLNEFRDDKLLNRLHANEYDLSIIQNLKDKQLEKSMKLLTEIEDYTNRSKLMAGYSFG